MRWIIPSILIAFVISFDVHAQSFNWQWAHVAGNDAMTEPRAIVVDNDSNVIAAGTTETGPLVFGNDTLHLPGNSVSYAVKYDQNGNEIWVNGIGASSGPVEGTSVAVDDSGNVFLLGDFYSDTLYVGSTIMTDSNYNGFQSDIFLVKYNSLGQLVWTQIIGGAGEEDAGSIAFDHHGHLILTGQFDELEFILGSDTLTTGPTPQHQASTYPGIFISQLDLNGNFIWAKQIISGYFTVPIDLCTDNFGFSYIAGSFGGTQIWFDTTAVNSNGAVDAFLAKYAPNGDLSYARTVGGTSWEYGMTVTADKFGNAYFAGKYMSYSITIGSNTYINAGNNSGAGDIFLIKYDAYGNLTWSKSFGSMNDERPGDLVSDSVGNVFMTGGFDLAYPIVFPPETLYAPSGSCSFQCDPMFLVQFNSNGTCLSSLALQSGGDDICAIAEDRSGALYVTGDFMSTSFSLGPFNFPLQNNNSAFTHEEFFIAKLIPEISAGNESPLQHSLFTVFPNPSAGKFEFRSGENITGVMMITDIRGRIISEEKVNSNDLMIDLSGSDPGVYFYKIIFDNGEFLTGKLLRE